MNERAFTHFFLAIISAILAWHFYTHPTPYLATNSGSSYYDYNSGGGWSTDNGSYDNYDYGGGGGWDGGGYDSGGYDSGGDSGSWDSGGGDSGSW